MFCRNCGQENEAGAKFCTGCGASLDDVPAADAGQGAGQGVAWGAQSADRASGQPGWGADQGASQDAGWAQSGAQTETWYTPQNENGATHSTNYGDLYGGGAGGENVVPENGGQRNGLGVLAVVMVIVAVLCVVTVGALGTMYFMKLGPFAEEAVEKTEEGEGEESGREDGRDSDRDDRGDKDDSDGRDDRDDDFVSVPGVQGADRDEAVRELELLGLDVEIQEEHSSTVAEGLVISQSLSVGDDAEPGDTVVLTVSLGPEMKTVSRYTFVHQCLTWEQARQWCEDNGGHLATISSADELNQVVAQLPAEGVVSCWLGGYRTGGGWAWVDGSNFSYTAWAAGEPNNETGNENYVTLLKVKGSWSMYDVPNDVSDVYASSKIGFVMETEEQVPVS